MYIAIMSLQNVLAYVGAPLGLILGWSLNEVSKYLSDRKNDKKIKRSVIYHLLEIYTALIFSDYQKFEDAILEEYKATAIMKGLNLKDLMEHEDMKDFINNLHPHWELTMLQIGYDRYDKIKLNYTNTLEQLSTIDPIYSNNLSGFQNMLRDIFERKGVFKYQDQSEKIKMDKISIDIIKEGILSVIFLLAENRKMEKKINQQIIALEKSLVQLTKKVLVAISK
jgi:hypothetical protein